MSTSICPAGHESAADDYCDVCGAPIAAAGGPAEPGGASAGVPAEAGPAGGAGSGAAAGRCPHCGGENPAEALFCESCGYDFTTGALPREEPAASESSEAPASGGSAPEASVPDVSVPDAEVPDVAEAVAPDGDQAAGDQAAGDQAAGDQAAAAPAPVSPDPDAPDPVAPAVPPEWVVEMWVDPEWYEVQQSPDPCPSPGMPQVVGLTRRSVLVGRRSVSRSIFPDIDCSTDVGVSRRHAQLTTDGRRWWVEDLQSANGTFVGPATGSLPTDPVPPGQRRELAEDDRVYLGAWTRLVLRKATPEELEGLDAGA